MAKKKKRLHLVHLLILAPFIIVVDLISLFVPIIGSIVTGILVAIFWLMGIRTKGLGSGFFISMIIELIPGISALPGITGYLFFIYFVGRAEEEIGEATGIGEGKEQENKKGNKREKPSERVARGRAEAKERRNTDYSGKPTVREKKPGLQRPVRVGGEGSDSESKGKEGAGKHAPILGGEARFKENRQKLEEETRRKAEEQSEAA